MSTVMVISQIVLCILSAVVVISVLLQKPKDPRMGSAFGQSSSFDRALKTRTAETKLNAITKYGAIVLLCVSLILVVVQRFVG